MSSLEEVLSYSLPEAMKIFTFEFSCPLVAHHISGSYFRYWSDHNIARCFGGSCTRGSWNIIDLIMHYQKLDFSSALKMACEKLGIGFRGTSQRIIRQPRLIVSDITPGQYRQLEYKNVIVPRPAGDWPQDSHRFASALYFSDENLLIANRFYVSDSRVIPNESSLIVQKAEQVNVLNLCNNKFGAWVCINPIKGEQEVVEKISATSLSFYSKTHKGATDLTRYSYLLIESDSMSVDEQYSWLKASRLPIMTLTHSGGKSLHAVVLVDARNESEYKEKSSLVYEVLHSTGFATDSGNCNPNRYTRLPGVSRDGQAQYLIDTSKWEKFPTIDQWVDWMTLKAPTVIERELDAQTLWAEAIKLDFSHLELEGELSVKRFENQLLVPFVDLINGEVCGVLLISKSGRSSIIGRESFYPCLYAATDCVDLHICCGFSVFETALNNHKESVYYLAYEPECLEVWPVIRGAFERVFIHCGGDQDAYNAADYFYFLNGDEGMEVIINE